MKLQKQRADKESNSALIRKACLEILQEKRGRKPTIQEVSAKSGLSSTAVKKHLKTLDFGGPSDELCVFKVLTDDVILAMYRAAMKGNVAAAKLWFQVVEGWSEKTETTIEANVRVDNKPPVIIHIQ